MNISQLQYLTKKGGTRKFKVVGPVGERTGTWLDPWLGFLQFDDVEGAMMIKDFIMHSELQWFQVPEKEKDNVSQI
jgi:hypothetical protein